LDDLRAGFEIAERYKVGHGWVADVQDAIGQGSLFWQYPKERPSYGVEFSEDNDAELKKFLYGIPFPPDTPYD
jgi:hypothetical protein